MQNLIESVMTYNYYPNQTPAWEGWEYIPKTEADVQALAKAAGFSSHEWAEEACLQYCPATNHYVVAVDGFVEELGSDEFKKILEALKK